MEGTESENRAMLQRRALWGFEECEIGNLGRKGVKVYRALYDTGPRGSQRGSARLTFFYGTFIRTTRIHEILVLVLTRTHMHTHTHTQSTRNIYART